jgi:flagellar assembly factor FliW
MQVDSHRFGTIDVPDERLVRLAQPVVGFEQFACYAVIEDAATAPVLWMQSIEAPEALFPVVDAYLVVDSYGVDLSEAEVAALELERPEEARVLFVLTLHPDPSAITVNLRAPIVWNTRRALAMQLVIADPELPVQHPIRAVAREGRCNKEVARACSDTPQG